MKLVDVAEFYSDQGGGVRTYINQKLTISHKLGVDCTIIAPGKEDKIEKREHGEIYWVKSPVIPVDKKYHLFRKNNPIHALLNDINPDVVEGSSPWRGGKTVAQWQGKAVKAFFMHQDAVAVYPQMVFENILSPKTVDFLFGWFWGYLRRMSNHYDTTIVTSNWMKHRVSSFNLNNPALFPFGIDKHLFDPALHDPALKQELLKDCGFDDPATPLLVTVSRHHPEKNLGTMLNAMNILNAENNVALYMIGDGPSRAWVEKKASKTKGAFVAGVIKDRQRLAKILASSDAMIHCGAAETFGLVIAEALCSGLPIAVPNRGAAVDFLDPRYSESHKVADAKDCARSIQRLLSRPQEEMHKAAFQASNQILKPEDHFQRLYAHYDQLKKAKQS